MNPHVTAWRPGVGALASTGRGFLVLLSFLSSVSPLGAAPTRAWSADALLTPELAEPTESNEPDLGDAVPASSAGASTCPYAAFGVSTTCLRGYGYTRGGHLHAGYDMGGVPPGTPIRSASAGRVIFSGFVHAMGWTVVVQDERGYGHVYGHMGGRRLNNRADRRPPGLALRGQWVEPGDALGPVGNTGRIVSAHRGADAGTHVHYALVANVPALLQSIARAGERSALHLGMALDATTTLVALPPPGLACSLSMAVGGVMWAHAAHASREAGAWLLWDTARVINAGGPAAPDLD